MDLTVHLLELGKMKDDKDMVVIIACLGCKLLQDDSLCEMLIYIYGYGIEVSRT